MGDYRLIGGSSLGSPMLSNFTALQRPSGDTYSLSTTADSGYLDLVVACTATFSGSATWVSNGDTTWNNSSNWADGHNLNGVPGTSLSRTADTASFSGSGSVTAITLDVTPSLAALSFSDSNYKLSGGSLTLRAARARPA